MIAKIIVSGIDREDARHKLVAAIDATSISPLITSIPMARDLLLSEEFESCKFYTRSIENNWADWKMPQVPDDWKGMLTACALKVMASSNSRRGKTRPQGTCWNQLEGIRP